jgi:phage gp36-like protein
MAYCAKADILKQISEAELGDLTDDTGAGAVKDDVVTAAIENADSEIDGYCGEKYTVPFTSVPGIVKRLSVDIALYNLYARREVQWASGMPDSRTNRYDKAIRLLEKVSQGKASLGEVPAPAGNPDEVAEASMNDRVFTRTSMEGW